MADVAKFTPLEFETLSPQEQQQRSQEFLARMKTRRTVREYSKDPVPFELIETAIAAAGTAPSGANQQPWTFVVVSNAEIKHKIRVAAEADRRSVRYRQRQDQGGCHGGRGRCSGTYH